MWAKPAPIAAALSAAASARAERGSDLAQTLVRFLVLVALFTAAGLSVLIMHAPYRSSTPVPLDLPSPSAEHSVAAPTAAGPRDAASTHSPQPDGAQPAAVAPVLAIPKAKLMAPAMTSETPRSQIAGMSSAPVYPQTSFPPPVMSNVNDADLPQARTIDRQPAIARLPGYILEVPSRQAQHDDYESSVH